MTVILISSLAYVGLREYDPYHTIRCTLVRALGPQYGAQGCLGGFLVHGKVFSVILPILVILTSGWGICYILTHTEERERKAIHTMRMGRP